MNVEEFQKSLTEIFAQSSDICVSADFQCEQTLGFPTSLCVSWELGKAWLQPNEYMMAPGEDITPVWQSCADYGFKPCASVDKFNSLLKELGEEAYEYGYISEDEPDGLDAYVMDHRDDDRKGPTRENER